MTRELSDYEKYIRTEELLGLQKREDELACADELTFQVIHQIAELHFKLVMQYLQMAKSAMVAGEPDKAKEHLHRVNLHMKHLPEVFTMVKVISPLDYHTIRLALGRGSGQDSPGFNQILQFGPTLWEPFEKLMGEKGLSPLDVHKEPTAHLALYQLMQELIQFDEGFQSFRYQHLLLVRRMIGLETNSLKGIPAQALQKGVRHEFYPVLWKAISELTDWTGSSYNPRPLGE
ncbi:tryptophan 2,3-dioxygenase family protein [Brevibacillus borstelensis]|uniref:tryptophan 2,3-dioxygenase family protein n=1 Tax=Brevibacillus borstelensis TaxID=45462 RepID=UPI00287FCBF7|nr:tryptophan 2,3-dioxygenase family protein [Brevibacillus borstelensis]MED1872720.1 tryptophan 2,3-dioxygenase family protein [Brevibacillus borstelensis]WNF07746.1 tryptophan 2,3-dioxygenase family protein [Brevibacillus borstelensis]